MLKRMHGVLIDDRLGVEAADLLDRGVRTTGGRVLGVVDFGVDVVLREISEGLEARNRVLRLGSEIGVLGALIDHDRNRGADQAEDQDARERGDDPGALALGPLLLSLDLREPCPALGQFGLAVAVHERGSS
ncbi:hypothetical protein [Pengzhenrongella phosphoraccumulans]|uniref:hypothetical protein n=1 Tax=Pengzhenrongella phosphoraccumulans TaxID=3114394 RepID=UPI003891073F